jgi:hypothetical protein
MGTYGEKELNNQGLRKAQGISNPLPKRLFTLSEGAYYLGRSLWSMRELVWNGQIPIVRSGKRIFVDIGDLDAWITKNKSVVP